jgi:mRNA interferase HicA
VEDVAKKYRDVKRILRRAGWKRLRTEGSHETWRHADGRRVVVAAGGKSNDDVPVGTLASIRRSTGIEELR